MAAARVLAMDFVVSGVGSLLPAHEFVHGLALAARAVHVACKRHGKVCAGAMWPMAQHNGWTLAQAEVNVRTQAELDNLARGTLTALRLEHDPVVLARLQQRALQAPLVFSLLKHIAIGRDDALNIPSCEAALTLLVKLLLEERLVAPLLLSVRFGQNRLWRVVTAATTTTVTTSPCNLLSDPQTESLRFTHANLFDHHSLPPALTRNLEHVVLDNVRAATALAATRPSLRTLTKAAWIHWKYVEPKVSAEWPCLTRLKQIRAVHEGVPCRIIAPQLLSVHVLLWDEDLTRPALLRNLHETLPASEALRHMHVTLRTAFDAHRVLQLQTWPSLTSLELYLDEWRQWQNLSLPPRLAHLKIGKLSLDRWEIAYDSKNHSGDRCYVSHLETYEVRDQAYCQAWSDAPRDVCPPNMVACEHLQTLEVIDCASVLLRLWAPQLSRVWIGLPTIITARRTHSHSPYEASLVTWFSHHTRHAQLRHVHVAARVLLDWMVPFTTEWQVPDFGLLQHSDALASLAKARALTHVSCYWPERAACYREMLLARRPDVHFDFAENVPSAGEFRDDKVKATREFW